MKRMTPMAILMIAVWSWFGNAKTVAEVWPNVNYCSSEVENYIKVLDFAREIISNHLT